MSNVIKAPDPSPNVMYPSMANKHWISEIKTKILRVAYEIDEDQYSKEETIKALDDIANELDQLYPR